MFRDSNMLVTLFPQIALNSSSAYEAIVFCTTKDISITKKGSTAVELDGNAGHTAKALNALAPLSLLKMKSSN